MKDKLCKNEAFLNDFVLILSKLYGNCNTLKCLAPKGYT